MIRKVGLYMTILEQLNYDIPILYDEYQNKQGLTQKVYFIKTYSKSDSRENYFFKIYDFSSEEPNPIGYIYFFLNKVERTSSFIGIYVKNEYRNSGIASLLISYWISFCLNQNFDFLKTNRKQRKPFLLYLLKKFNFEIPNPSIYQTHAKTISICQKPDDTAKYLWFKNFEQRTSFENSKIIKEDNYYIIDEIQTPYQEIDQIILSGAYRVQKPEEAYNKARQRLKDNKI